MEEEWRVLEETRNWNDNETAGNRARISRSGLRGIHFGSSLTIAHAMNAPIWRFMLDEMVANSFETGQGMWREAVRSLEVSRNLEEVKRREKERRLLEVTKNLKENTTAARIEEGEENPLPRERNPLEGIEMPCRADYKCAMSSLDLYQSHEMYFYEHA